MLVSAISANNTPIRALNVKGGDNGGDNSFDFMPVAKQNSDMKSLFNSINEWKNFCHSQMDKGNFDIIA
jgi:hypothetical protein